MDLLCAPIEATADGVTMQASRESVWLSLGEAFRPCGNPTAWPVSWHVVLAGGLAAAKRT